MVQKLSNFKVQHNFLPFQYFQKNARIVFVPGVGYPQSLTGGPDATVAATSTGRPTARFDLGVDARTGAARWSPAARSPTATATEWSRVPTEGRKREAEPRRARNGRRG